MFYVEDTELPSIKKKTKKSFEIIVLLSALFPRLSSIFWNKGAHKKMMRAILFHGCYRVNLISLSHNLSSGNTHIFYPEW